MKTTWAIMTASLMVTAYAAPLDREKVDTAISSLRIEWPATARPFPEPLPAGAQPGFKFRGTKGWAWTPRQYMEEIPWLAKFKMNFLMNCYLSLFASTQPWNNEWWMPLPAETKAAYAEVIHACETNGITFCFCMNPQLASKRPLNPDRAGELDLLFQHYAWAQLEGVKWFSLCVDDAGWGKKGPGEAASADAKMVNTILGRLRERDAEAQMIFCPGPYQGDGTEPNAHAYLQTLGQRLDAKVYVFWVGDATVTPRITRSAATSYKQIVNHRLFLWDNYPVNDHQPTLHLGPVSGRAPDLCEVAEGYLSNPMAPQNQVNRLPLATCADYAYNPRAYDPARSIGQAILLFGKTTAQQEALKEMVETYPGVIATGGGTGTNPVRNRFKKLAAESGPPAAQKFIREIESLTARLEREFPGQFDDAKESVRVDVAWMKQPSNSP
jgi:hypothetical protein